MSCGAPVFGGALVLLLSLCSTAATADDGIKALIAVAQQQAEQASDDARSAADRQKKLNEQKRAIRNADVPMVDAKDKVDEHVMLVKQAAEVQMSIASLSQASGSASAFCNAEDRGLKPLVLEAQRKSELTERKALAAAGETRRLIDQTRSAADKQALLDRLRQLESAATRQKEISGTLQDLMREIGRLSACAPGAPDRRSGTVSPAGPFRV
ncbi:MAG: hypothetical protein ACRETY_04880 [Steroidobacteraceae bacterium]